MIKICITVIVLSVLSTTLNSQVQVTPTVIAASSNYAQIGGLEVSYTIAEMTLVNTGGTGGLTVTQGFHQPEEFGPLAIENAANYDYGSLEIFPVPVSDKLNYELAFPQAGKFEVKVTDVAGKLIQSLPAIDYSSGKYAALLNISSYVAGNYILQVFFSGNDNQMHIKGKKFIVIK